MSAEFVTKEPEEVVLGNDPIPEPASLDQDQGDDGGSPPPRQPDDEPQPRERVVPYGALHQERQVRQRLAAELAAERQRNAERLGLLQGRLEEINRWREEQSRQQSAAPEEPEPDMNADPQKWVNYQFAKRDRDIRRVQEDFKKQLEQRDAYIREREQEFRASNEGTQRVLQEQTQHQQLTAGVSSDESDFAAQAPDYYDAVDFLAAQRHRELQIMGVTDKGARDVAIGQEITNLSRRAFQEGRSPAEIVYQLARTKGFGNQQNGNGTGQVQRRLDTIRRGQQVARTASSAPGAQNRQPLSLDSLAGMSEQEFRKFVPDMKAFRKMHEI